MKRTTPIFAIGVAAMTLAPIAANAGAGIKQAQVSGTVQFDEGSSRRKWHPRARVDPYWEVYEGPRACSSVRFPRSPLCASVRPGFSPYGFIFPRAFF
jgi:hypothetical protein